MGINVICITLNKSKLEYFNEHSGIAIKSQNNKTNIESLNADVIFDVSGDPEAIHNAILGVKKIWKSNFIGKQQRQYKRI